MADTGRHQIIQRRGTEPPGTDDRHTRGNKRLLHPVGKTLDQQVAFVTFSLCCG